MVVSYKWANIIMFGFEWLPVVIFYVFFDAGYKMQDTRYRMRNTALLLNP